MTRKTPAAAGKSAAPPAGYASIHDGIVELLDAARQAAARSVNALMTASYWEVGRRIVEAEQKGRRRAGYGEQLMERLSADLAARFGRGFGVNNLQSMRRFFLVYPSLTFPRHCLGNPESAYPQGVPRHHLGNSISPNWPRFSLCHGPPMSGCCRSRMTMPASSTRPRRCAVAGACGSLTGKSEASSTSARPCPGTRRRCLPKGPCPGPGMP